MLRHMSRQVSRADRETTVSIYELETSSQNVVLIY